MGCPSRWYMVTILRRLQAALNRCGGVNPYSVLPCPVGKATKVAIGILLTKDKGNGKPWALKYMHLKSGMGDIMTSTVLAILQKRVQTLAINVLHTEANIRHTQVLLQQQQELLGQAERSGNLEAVRAALKNAKRVVILEKTFAVGIGGILATDVRTAMDGMEISDYTVVAGLGGRSITKKSLCAYFEKAVQDDVPALSFLDLEWDIVNKQLERERLKRRSGPTAENILRDVGSGHLVQQS